MTPTYRTSGNRFSHEVHPGYRSDSRLGGAFETALSIKRIGLIPALKIANIIAWSVIVAISAIYAASDATPPASKQNATPIEARSGGKVSL